MRKFFRIYEPKLAVAFSEAIRLIKSRARVGQIIREIEAGAIDRVMELLTLERAAFNRFETLVEEIYGAAGAQVIRDLGKLKDTNGEEFSFLFDRRATTAEDFLRNYSSNRITNILERQRNQIRDALTEGLVRGDNPRRVALDIIGRQSVTRRGRTGGIIGLSENQIDYVRNATNELLEGRFGEFLQRKRRNRNFDHLISRAIKEGRPLRQSEIDKIVDGYKQRLLKWRGETIARTETLTALNAGNYNSVLQMIETGKVREDQVKRVWDATGDRRTRTTHSIADGQEVGLNEPFIVGGHQLLYPGDPDAPAEERVNCRCIARTEIDFLAGVL